MAAFGGAQASGVCEVYSSPLHADGVRAVRALARDEVVVEERPFVFLQTLENRQCNAVCAGCQGFLGGLDLQLGLLARRVSRQDQQSIAQGGGVVLCGNQCGELYCSEQCRHEHWHSRGHRHLCTGLMDATDALVRFKVHAVQTNEIFLLVADVYCLILESVDRLLAGAPPAMGGGGEHSSSSSSSSSASSLTLEEAVAQSLRPLEGYVRQLWWDAAVAPPGSDPTELRETLQALVAESWGLLSEALRLQERGLATVLGPEFMARLIGTFEQNNVGVRAVSPIATLCQRVGPGDPAAGWLAAAAEEVSVVLEAAAWEDCGDEDCDGGEDEDEDEGEGVEGEGEGEEGEDMDTADASAAAAAAAAAAEAWSPDKAGSDEQLQRLYAVLGREGGIDAVFPPLDGTAFYRLVCKINHSCEPNVLVRYAAAEPNAPASPLVARLCALRDIAPGEELVQSYIDQGASWEVRRAALRDYGFECNCGKCLRRE